MAGASVIKTAELLCFSRATISRTMTEFKKRRKTSSNRSNSSRIYKLTDGDRRTLKRIVGRKYRTTAAKVTAELNQNLNSPVSTKTVHRGLNKARYRGRADIRKPLFSTNNIQNRLKWCRDQKSEGLACTPMEASDILR